MRLANHTHLTYCTNIHPGESWAEVWAALQQHIPAVRQQVCSNQPFGIGLRLSDLASRQILENEHLELFKAWLQAQNAYVFTMNGFPFGGFHYQRVKDAVHTPDWTSRQRLDYTVRLANILAALLPAGIAGGISTSPLSYAPWHRSAADLTATTQEAAKQLARAALAMFRIFEQTGQMIHIDLEPEPDGIMEDLATTLQTFRQFIFPASDRLAAAEGIPPELLRAHLQLCYDVCHFAVAFEPHAEALKQLSAEGIRIGKFQLSAALRVQWQDTQREAQRKVLTAFDEPTYLHQVVARSYEGSLLHFSDLPQALASAEASAAAEWRTHFHVPIFLDNYGLIQSTQQDIVEVLQLQQQYDYSRHLEVETYTWTVLPADMQLPVAESIARELQWVKNIVEQMP
ncbi:metabolite traffic protein EboE [Rhodoflexus caldus]|uniref:metabolite traffic protein EboE n=1 Tax=Rhodoflexus caldus TaxID=2891236 RepID=UPI00202A471E|nr:metabolite traffic protein EboE [Rhodoflexus caldus]